MVIVVCDSVSHVGVSVLLENPEDRLAESW